MIITIARQCGCGALHIGEQLSAFYGIPFYTRKNLLEMARQKGVLEEMDDFFEERPVDELMFAISQFDDEPKVANCKAFEILYDLIGSQDWLHFMCYRLSRKDVVSLRLLSKFSTQIC